jgi:cobalamin biosynthetic protein CobC
MLEHGGNRIEAARRYDIAIERWLDLSTGINPHAWQGAMPSSASWQRLPEADDGLLAVASKYYGSAQLLAVSGSQSAIQILPRMRTKCRIGVIKPSYAEHAHRWRAAGHEITALRHEELLDAADRFDVLLVCNPNNPDGQIHAPAKLLDAHARLAQRGGWLIVDEAFIDATPQHSLAANCDREGLIVLRSFGKFFGLAGARVGFVLACPALLQTLDEWIGPWAVNGPARELARQALSDRNWQAAMRVQLQSASSRLATLLRSNGLAVDGGCALFQWIKTPHAEAIHHALATQGVLVRHFASPVSLRFGLPASETEWSRLDAALAALRAGGIISGNVAEIVAGITAEMTA